MVDTNGVATATQKEGTVTITAKAGDKTAEANLQVQKEAAMSGLWDGTQSCATISARLTWQVTELNGEITVVHTYYNPFRPFVTTLKGTRTGNKFYVEVASQGTKLFYSGTISPGASTTITGQGDTFPAGSCTLQINLTRQ